ncbi:hypothetical protein K488DRAFT_72460 [Vararia minispora EC-137]|uniref:Uncharacterized protein n=1 Tax=Vararia minispora EC-137 TaxID=1314806 RepID=A0ACB8QE92_9AGAM|nr:hypothetical protein K488DRAFT_72460 [Vararia minispora EC-137]
MSTGTDEPHDHNSDDGPARFRALLKKAIDRFQEETSIDLLAEPYGKFLRCNSVDDLVLALEKQDEAFDAFRAHEESIRAVLAPVVRLVGVFLETGSEVAAASGVVPGGKAIFCAFGALLDVRPSMLSQLVATRGVSEVYDTLGVLFRRLDTFLGRLDIYLQSPSEPNAALKEIFMDTFFKLFAALRIVTKYLEPENNDKKGSGFRRLSHRVIRRMKDFGKVLFGKTEVKGVLEELDGLTSRESLTTAATTLVATQEIRVDVRDARKDVGTVRDYQVEKDIQDWLDPPDPLSNHDKLQELHQRDTCTWFFDEAFKKWKEFKNGLYWVNGNPGSGKSVLSSCIIEALSSETEATVLYFYFDFKETKKQTIIGLLSSLVFQLGTLSPQCHNILRTTRKEHRSRLKPNKDILFSCLENMLRVSSKIFVVIDALDECPEPDRYRGNGLFPTLRRLRNLGIDGLHLLMTSRPEHDIKEFMSGLYTHSLDIHSASGHAGDLARYIDQELLHPSYSKWPHHIKSLAKEILNSKANSMYVPLSARESFL